MTALGWVGRLWKLEPTRFVIVAAAVELFQGLSVYLFPDQFGAPVYAPLRPFLGYFSAGLVAGGLVLLASCRFCWAPWLQRVLFLVPAAPPLVLAWVFTSAGVWTGTVYYGLFAVAVLVAAWGAAAGQAAERVDLAVATLAAIEAAAGGFMLLAPGAFPAAYYGPLGPALRLVGLAGVAGAAGLVASELSRRRTTVWVGRAAGALFPSLLAYGLSQTGVWTGVAAWGTWVPVVLFGRTAPARRADRVALDDPEAVAVDRLLETWSWLLALAVVGITTVGGEAARAVSPPAHVFVVAISVWNFVVHTILSRVSTARQRVPLQMGFLTVAVGILLAGVGDAGHGFMMLLVALPALAARMAGLSGGLRTLGLGVAAVLFEEIGGLHSGGKSYLETVTVGLTNALVLIAAAGVGMRSADEQRKMFRSLQAAQGDLSRAHADLQAANEELLAQQEELIAQQQQIEAQNQELRQQHEELHVHRDRLEAALHSLQREAQVRTRLASIVEATTDLVITLDREGNPLYWNTAAGALRGLGEAEPPEAARFLAQQPDSTRTRLLEEAIPAALRDGVWKGETVFVNRDGEAIPFSAVVLAHGSEDGSEPFVSILARDIREHKRWEAMLWRSLVLEQSLRAIDRALVEEREPEEVLAVLCEKVTTFGYQVRGAYLVDPQQPSRPVACPEPAHGDPGQAARGEDVGGADGLPGRPDPERKPVVAVPLESAGEVLGALELEPGEALADQEARRALDVLVQHATLALVSLRRRRALEKWRLEALEAGTRFHALAETAAEGILMTDTEGRVTYCNPAAASMFGYVPDELAGRRASEILPGALDEPGRWEREGVHRDGRRVPVEGVTSRVETESGAFYAHIFRDLTERKQYEAQMLYLADHDLVTQVFNRRRFEEELARHLAETQRYGTRGAVLFVDADNFKEVNDRWGHRAGDAVLVELARLLEAEIGTRGILGRLGGDEFGVVLAEAGLREAQSVAERLVQAVRSHAFPGPSEAIRLTVSVGIAFFPDDGTIADEVVMHADQAMYAAKENGGDGWRRYESPDRRAAVRKFPRTWEDEIVKALASDRFVFFCQPIVDLETGRVAMYELLLRMVVEEGEVVPPVAFLDVAERTGVIHRIDRWVVEQAIRLLAVQQKAGRAVRLAVNVSGLAFEDKGLLTAMAHQLAVSGARATDLMVEITESAAITDVNAARRFVRALKRLGARVALDDFGVGFSSLQHLKHFPVDCLKIDGSFVRYLARDAVDQHLVRTVAEAARRLRLETVAEFVEDEETVRLLRESGVRYGQGYYFGRPRPVGEVLGV